MKFGKALKKMREGHYISRVSFPPRAHYCIEEGVLVCYGTDGGKRSNVTLSGKSLLADDWYVVDHGKQL